jgi:hypothetical protein
VEQSNLIVDQSNQIVELGRATEETKASPIVTQIFDNPTEPVHREE